MIRLRHPNPNIDPIAFIDSLPDPLIDSFYDISYRDIETARARTRDYYEKHPYETKHLMYSVTMYYRDELLKELNGQ